MPITLGSKIYQLRKAKKLTLEELGNLTDSSKSYIWELENKNPPRPSAEKIDKIATVLGVTSAYLIDETEESPTPDVVDAAFFRKYRQLDEATKDKIRRMIDLWDESEVIKSKSPIHWANDITLVLNAAFGDNRFPVDVKQTALDYSKQLFPEEPITVVKGDALPKFDGALYRAPIGKKGWGIFFNSSIASLGRINFTLAHEFGHYLVHRHLNPEGIECGEQDFVRWDSAYGQMEKQANDFAATLLMPLDDFRKQIKPKDSVNFDMISNCADRYRVSLIAATLRWLSYTEKRAVLVVSRDGYILWARSSEPAWKTGIYIKTSGRGVEVPERSRVAIRNSNMADINGVEVPEGTWFPEKGIKEMVIESERYDFAISLLLLKDQPEPLDEKPVRDAYEQLQHLKWKY